MEKRAFKDTVYNHLAELVKAIANPRRLEILELLAQGSYSVEQIAGETELSTANASQHLQVMKRVQLVETRKQGVTVYYRLAGRNVYRAWRALRDLGMEKNAEIARVVQEYRQEKGAVEGLSLTELYEKMERDQVRIIDVRPETEYEEGHISRAESIPVEQLEQRLRELSRSQEIVVYCRGPFCVFADEAAELLKEKGYDVKRLEEGFPEWLLEGLPVEKGGRGGEQVGDSGEERSCA